MCIIILPDEQFSYFVTEVGYVTKKYQPLDLQEGKQCKGHR